MVGGASVVMNSTYTRCAYLLTSALQESSMMMKVVKDIIYPQLLPVFIQIAQILIDSSQKNENSHNYENCRILWNCELYAASILPQCAGDDGSISPRGGFLVTSVAQYIIANPKHFKIFHL